MIVFVVKSFFFSRANNYSLRQKFHTSNFFYLFCEEIIRVAYTILTITIKDLELRLDNSNLPLGKSAIRFKLLVQKRETDKQITNTLYY